MLVDFNDFLKKMYLSFMPISFMSVFYSRLLVQSLCVFCPSCSFPRGYSLVFIMLLMTTTTNNENKWLKYRD